MKMNIIYFDTQEIRQIVLFTISCISPTYVIVYKGNLFFEASRITNIKRENNIVQQCL